MKRLYISVCVFSLILVLGFTLPSAAQNQQNKTTATQTNQHPPGPLQIVCYSLRFGVSATLTSTQSQNKPVNSITCLAILNGFALGLFHDVASGHQFETVTLVWKDSNLKPVLDAQLTNGILTGFQITQEGQLPVAEITFRFEKLDVFIDGKGYRLVPPEVVAASQ
jgi:hypothetical protein